MVCKLLVGLFAVRIISLHLDALDDGIVLIANMEIEPAVSFGLNLIVEICLEVLVIVLGPKIRTPAFPPLFPGPRRERERTVSILTPVSGRFPIFLEVVQLLPTALFRSEGTSQQQSKDRKHCLHRP